MCNYWIVRFSPSLSLSLPISLSASVSPPSLVRNRMLGTVTCVCVCVCEKCRWDAPQWHMLYLYAHAQAGTRVVFCAEATHHRPKQFRFLDFRVEMLFHSIILCFVFCRFFFCCVAFFLSFCVGTSCSLKYSVSVVRRCWFFFWFLCVLLVISFFFFRFFCSILFVLLIVYLFRCCRCCCCSEIERSQSKWFLLMKLELLFHLAVSRPFVQFRTI